jgi:hypothetical protein
VAEDIERSLEPMISVSDALEVLNRVHEADPTVMPALIALRVPCNEAVADDPTVQVATIPADQIGKRDGYFEVGVLGLINGLFGVDDQGIGHIGAFYDDSHQLTHFGWVNAPTEP